MKIRTLTILASSLVLIGGLSACGSRTSSNDAAVATDASKTAPTGPATAATPEAETPTPIPAGGADAIWQAIDQKSAELDKAIHDGSLGNVHHMAFAIRDLVTALPERSGSLSTDQKTKVQGSVKFVATLAERLDASGDAKDVAETRANFDKLTSVLADLRTNYAK
jgi:hypothetical protein